MTQLRMFLLSLPTILAQVTVLILGTAIMNVAVAEEPTTIQIQASPATIVLSSLGGCVSIHADIAYSAVDRQSLELNGLKPYLVKADARGDLVAKFSLDEVKAIVAPPSTTLTLIGLTRAGEAFTGSDEVAVRDNE